MPDDPTKRTQRGKGRPAGTLKIHGDWKDAMRRSLTVKRPAKGWPRPSKAKARKRAG